MSGLQRCKGRGATQQLFEQTRWMQEHVAGNSDFHMRLQCPESESKATLVSAAWPEDLSDFINLILNPVG